MTTIEEKQKELDALQTAFDEYIVSSRELEEELDDELTKCQNDLTKAESRNTALASQLSNIQPQLNSLETKLSTLTTQLSTETQHRISAEMKSEEAENKLRESEGTLAAVRSSEVRKLKEENEDLCERLAFVDGEADDYRNELNTEREQHREVLEELKGDVNVLKARLQERDNELKQLKSTQETAGLAADKESTEEDDIESILDGQKVDAAPLPTAETEPTTGTTSDEREEYVKTLEDELELVTEQLIEAETKLSQTQAELEEALVEAEEANKKLEDANSNGSSAAENVAAEQSGQITELESSIKLLEEENAALQEEAKQLKEELELALEELALSKEELEAYEEDRKELTNDFDLERKHHKDEVAALQTQLDKASSEERAREIEAKSWEEALVESKKESQSLQEEVGQLEVALRNSKADCEVLQQEMEVLKVAFDETADREKVGEANSWEEALVESKKETQSSQEEVGQLEAALRNSKADCEVLQQEMEVLKVAFDETADREKVESEGQHKALEELFATRSREMEELKEEVTNLTDTNSSLAKMLKDMEANLQKREFEIERQQKNLTSASASSSQELQDAQDEIYSVEGLLEVARKELDEQRSEMQKVRSSLEEKIEHTQEELSTAEEELARTQSKLLEVEREGSSARHLEEEIKQLKNQVLRANNNVDRGFSEEKKESTQELVNIDDAVDEVEGILQSNNPEMIAKEVRLMAKKMSAQKSHNAQLLTRILKLQGNIQVCCRIRPMSVDESQKGLHEVAQSLSETEIGCLDHRTKAWKSYAFDKVWGPGTWQKDVFQDVEPMVLSVIDGYNACIFAYGQTGSGKTFTMEGNKENSQYGISQRTIQKIFTLLQDKARQHQNNPLNDEDAEPFEYTIEVGMLEIYNDEVYDLLDPGFSSSSIGSPKKKSLDIRHSTDNTVEVPGLIKEKVNSVSEVLDCLDRGNNNRAKAATNLNEHSSRSHMVLHIEVTAGVGQTKSKASLSLIDLAGSERVRKSEVEGQALKEAQHINKSLSALGNVMEALDRKSSHVPYRDSKLTHLLQNSLGGNSRTMMICTVCPHNDSFDETAFALKFATRVRRINLGTANKNVAAKNLEEQNKNLMSELKQVSKSKERQESQLLSLKREKERVEEKLSKSAQSRSESKEEMRTLAVLRKNNDDVTQRYVKEKNIREEKTVELGKIQEELQRVQRDLRTVKSKQESLVQQNEDKENTIHHLKKDLRSTKEQLNEEKIRHRRSQVMQSDFDRKLRTIPRIPAPKRAPRARSPKRENSSRLMKPSARVNSAAKTPESSTADIVTNDPNSVLRIRHRVIKILNEHEPLKVDKIDSIMKKFEGRETELLEKMMAKFECDSKSVASKAETESAAAPDDGKPKSRADIAKEKHMARMKRIRASGSKD